MNDEEPLDEFLEDFGGPVPSEEDLESVLSRARVTEDRTLRLVVKEVKMRRWLCRLLLERLELGEVMPDDQLIKMARFLVRGEGAIGRSDA
jgi:hypothetical protein